MGGFFQIFVASSQYLNFTIQVTMEQWNQNILEVSMSVLYTIFISVSVTSVKNRKVKKYPDNSEKIYMRLWKYSGSIVHGTRLLYDVRTMYI